MVDYLTPNVSFERCCHRFTTTMTRGQPVSEAIQWTIIRLSAVMPSHEISGYTDTSDRKIRDILSYFKKTGRHQA